MTNLLVVKKTAQLRTLTLLSFFLLLFFVAACTSHPTSTKLSEKYALTAEEKVCLREFFHDLLFEDHGAYVLYGTKPASLSCIQPPLSDAEENQLQSWLDSLSPEEKATMRKRERFDFYENFHKWEKIKHRFPIHQYLFGKFQSQKYERDEFLLFVNIETTLRILLKYYPDFKRALGFDFDPMQVVFDVENPDSKFWNAVLQSAPAQGILLGYGQDNAWFFKWRAMFKNTHDPKGDFTRSLVSQAYEEQDILYPSPQNFLLPVFVNFGLYQTDQQLIEQYKQDQKKIKKLYKGRDEVDVALEWLTR